MKSNSKWYLRQEIAVKLLATKKWDLEEIAKEVKRIARKKVSEMEDYLYAIK